MANTRVIHVRRRFGRLHLVAVAIVLVTSSALAQEPRHEQPRTRVRDNGFLEVSQKAFFPLGIYHDGLDADRYGDALLADFETIVEARFNCVATSIDFTWDGNDAASSTAGKLAARAEQSGTYLIPHIYLPSLQEAARQHAQWPGILMSSIGDDFNSDEDGRFQQPPKFSPARLRELSSQVKHVAPQQLTYTSGSAHPRAPLAGYGDSVAVLGMQCYPYGDENQAWHNELEATQDLLSSYWQRTAPHSNPALIANLQAFAWRPDRPPTTREVRLQAWLALISQTRGILWYSFLSLDTKQPLPEAHPEVWNELKQLVPELHSITTLIAEGHCFVIPNADDRQFDGGPGTWHAALWQHEERGIVVVVNCHRTASLTIDVALPILVSGRAERPFAADRYGAGLTIQQQRLRGQLAPESVEVLRWGPASNERGTP